MGMGKRGGVLFIAGGSLELIGWGLGMIPHIPEQVGYAAVGVGFAVFVVAVVRFVRYKSEYPTWQELQARGEAKRWYLDPLKGSIEQIIKAYNMLAAKAVVFPLKEYNKKYFRIETQNGKDILAKMTASKFWLNNRYYRELKSLPELDGLKLEYQKWYSNVADKVLRQELAKWWKCEHQAKSNDIFYEIERTNFKETLTKANVQSWQRGNSKREYENQLGKVYARIKELLDGMPDEQ